jgi:hypothetical protein
LKGIDMIDTETVESFNTRLTVDTSNISRLTPSQRDQIKHYGSQAEALLKNRDLAMFVHHYKFELADGLANITGHSDTDNQTRVALSNYLSGIDGFVTSLKRAIYQKNKITKAEQQPGVDNTPI